MAWDYARAADRHGVDIVENCEVTGFLREGDRVVGVETAKGPIAAVREVVEIAVALMPCISRLRLLRHWGGVMDMTPMRALHLPHAASRPLSQRRLVL